MTKADEVLDSLRQPPCICGHDKEDHLDCRLRTGFGDDYDVVDWWCNGCESINSGPEPCGGTYKPVLYDRS